MEHLSTDLRFSHFNIDIHDDFKFESSLQASKEEVISAAMCGIYFSISTSGFVSPDEKTLSLLRNRGPDCICEHKFQLPCQNKVSESSSAQQPSHLRLTFISTVLALRGDHIQSQPLVDASSQSVLCWNGEAWRVSEEPVRGNDTQYVFQLLLEALKPSPSSSENSTPSIQPDARRQSLQKLATVISRISGPFSFVLYDGFHSRIIYGRDSLGRRSLLSGWDEAGSFKISSVCDGTSSKYFDEVDTDGLHVIELADSTVAGRVTSTSQEALKIETIPWVINDDYIAGSCTLRNPIPLMNKALPDATAAKLTLTSPCVISLGENLRISVETRVQNIPEPPYYPGKNSAKVAVLFSGGLDCTVLARLAHELLSIEEPIDLLNVAFENPRRVAAAAAEAAKSKAKPNTVPASIYEECPDRVTGRSSLAELQNTCPGRTWRFVAINIPYSQTLEHRDEVKRLMRPHNTEMDLSIACALYFASRGQGELSDPENSHPTTYTTTARVLLSGLGADELFAGYTRHTTAFSRHGFQGLIDEIDLDVCRLGKRNLGRDDRVISHWGREVRFPYLDEDFLSWAVKCPVWEKCGFGGDSLATHSFSRDDGSHPSDQEPEPELEPGKQILRLLAWKIGLKNVSKEKKRAIQFGSRTAKMESGRSKGTQILS